MPTSDGISDDDWVIVRNFAEQIASYVSRGVDPRHLIKQLIQHLRSLEARYGPLPSIISTEADYTIDKRKELRLLKEAYATACEISDDKNQAYITASLTEYYLERARDLRKARYWCGVLHKTLERYTDEYIKSTFESASQELRTEQ